MACTRKAKKFYLQEGDIGDDVPTVLKAYCQSHIPLPPRMDMWREITLAEALVYEIHEV